MIYIDILLIGFITVAITDNTDVKDYIKRLISSVLTSGKIKNSNIKVKLIDCSLCQTHWLSVILMFVTNNISIGNYAYILLISILTPEINSVIILFKTLINKTLNKIMNEIER